MTIQNLFDFSRDAFSVAVSVYLLVRVERTLESLIRAVELMRHCPTCRLSPFDNSISLSDDDNL